MKNEIVFATNNKHKLDEVISIFGDAYKILSLNDINFYEEVHETENTFEGNALLKARIIYDKYKIACFSDDSGLEVAALNNAPGVFSARYAGEPVNHEKNIDKLLKEMTNKPNRDARFRTVICFINNQGVINYFNGIIKGSVTQERYGTGGFGYDAVFIPEGDDRTFAQMTASEKNHISHRALAVKELLNFLENNYITL